MVRATQDIFLNIIMLENYLTDELTQLKLMLMNYDN